MKYSLCIEPVFEDKSFYERILAARDCGVDAVEFWNPFRYDVEKLSSVVEREGINVAACGLGDNWKFRLNLPFPVLRREFEKCVELGKRIRCRTFIGLSGDRRRSGDQQTVVIIENLKRLNEICERQDVTIVLEALNSLYDHKGYFLDSADEGFGIIKAVGSKKIKLLYDCYHMQIMEGNIIRTIEENHTLIGHFHSAGVPGRHELMNCELNYPEIIRTIENCGYNGYFGLEYWPSYENEKSVKDVLAYLKGE